MALRQPTKMTARAPEGVSPWPRASESNAHKACDRAIQAILRTRQRACDRRPSRATSRATGAIPPHPHSGTAPIVATLCRNGTTTECGMTFDATYQVHTRPMALASCLRRTPAAGMRPTVLISSSAALARTTCINTRLDHGRLCGPPSVMGSSFRRSHARGRPADLSLYGARAIQPHRASYRVPHSSRLPLRCSSVVANPSGR